MRRFAQFDTICTNRQKHPWRSVTFSKVTLLNGCFSRFLNCVNGIKSCEVAHISIWNCPWYCLFVSLKLSRKSHVHHAFLITEVKFLLSLLYWLANSVNTKCRPYRLIAIPFCKIVIDALEQGAHGFVSFLLLTLIKLLSNEFLIDKGLMKKYYKNNCESHEIATK